MVRPNRKALLLAAVAGFGFVATSHGQTWVNPNTGNWSVPANWTPGLPTSANTTALYFNATGAQSYVATNDIGAFSLNSLNLNNSGTGAVNLAGSTLNFGGAAPSIVENGSGAVNIGNPINFGAHTTFGGTGSGTVTIGGALGSTPVSDGVSGFGLIVDNPNARLNLAGGGTIHKLQANRGTTTISGGNFNINSLTAITQASAPSLDVAVSAGNVAGQTGTILITGGIHQTGNIFIGNIAGATGYLTVTGSSTRLSTSLSSFGQGRLAAKEGAGTISILNGAQVQCLSFEPRGAGPTLNLMVDGAGSKLQTGQFLLGRDSTPNATVTATISNGAVVESYSDVATGWSAGAAGPVSISEGDNVKATLNILSGGLLVSDYSVIIGAADTAAGAANAAGTLLVSGANSELRAKNLYTRCGWFATTVNEDAPDWNIRIDNGGKANLGDFDGSYGSSAVGTLVVSGSGSQWNVLGDGLSTIGEADLGFGIGATVTARFEAGGTGAVASDFSIGTAGGANVGLTVTGAGSAFTQTVTGELGSLANFSYLAGRYTNDDGNLSTAVINVLNGGSMTVDNLYANVSQTVSAGTINVDGDGSVFSAAICFAGIAGPNATTTINASNGGIADFGAQLSASAGDTAGTLVGTSNINVTTGGQVSASDFMEFAGNVGTANISVDGTDSILATTAGGDIVMASDNGARATMNITNGGAVAALDISTNAISGGIFAAPDVGGIATINMSGGSSSIAASFLGVAGSGSVAQSAGTAIVNHNNGDGIFGLVGIYNNGTYNLNGGTLDTLGALVFGRINYNGGIALMGDTEVSGGKIVLSSGNNKTLQTTSLTINSNGLVDINDNGLIVNYDAGSLSPASTIRGYIKSARNTGAWDGATGITSAAAAANPSKFGVGYAHVGTGSAEVNITAFRGINVDTDTVVVRETYNGDADLNGDVDSVDFNRFLAGYGMTSGADWANGDFNYDDKVNTADFNYISGNFGEAPLASPLPGPALGEDGVMYLRTGEISMDRQSIGHKAVLDLQQAQLESRNGELMSGSLGSVVPEPASISCVAIAAMGFAGRRRRG